jgi:hypothetical protein
MAWTLPGHGREIEGREGNEYHHLPASWFVGKLREIENNSHLKQSYAEPCVLLSDTPSISYEENKQKRATPISPGLG